MSKKVPLSGFVWDEQRLSVGCPRATAAVPSRQVSEWLQQPRKAATGCLARTTIRQLARPLSPSTTPGTWHLALTWYCQAISLALALAQLALALELDNHQAAGQLGHCEPASPVPPNMPWKSCSVQIWSKAINQHLFL